MNFLTKLSAVSNTFIDGVFNVVSRGFLHLVEDNGFLSVNEFFQSAYRYHTKFENIIIAGITFAAFDNLLNAWFGMPMIAWFLFNVLVIFEFVTGILVARKVRKEKVTSKKLSRGLFKVVVYMATIGLLHSLSIHLPIGEFFQKNNLNPYTWMYHAVLHITTMIMVISLIENLGKLHVMDADPVLKVIRSKFNQWFELKDDTDTYSNETEDSAEPMPDAGPDVSSDSIQQEGREIPEEDL